MKKCYVIPTENCSCDCTFCISKSRDYDHKQKLSQKRPFLQSNLDIINTLGLRGIKNFEITGGGEPFLDGGLEQKISLIKKLIPDAFIKIYTNGNHLKKLDGLDEINISLAHYDDEINKKIMNPKVYVPLIDKLTFFRNNYPDAKIRLSIPLLKEGIHSAEGIEKMIDITKRFDVDYVIRTIYPNTPNYNQNYVDVNYEHPRIKYERDNGVSDFSEVIWWSNNELYADWSLQRKKHLFSYLLLKPDAQIYLDEILKMLEQENLQYSVRIYKDIEQIMYLYRDKPDEYKKIISSHLRCLALLFGKEFLVLFINRIDSLSTIDECVAEASKIKQEIRNKYSFTYANNGTINYEENHVQANLVHAPDSSGIKFDEDVDFLDNLDYVVPKDAVLTLARRYRTFKI